MRRASLLPLLPLLGLLLPSCTFIQGNPRVLVTSTPAGAEILVDGKDTGKTTPYKFELTDYGSHAHTITVRKKGYEPESRRVYFHRETRTSKWTEGVAQDFPLTLPLFWTFGDMFLPFAYRWEFVPGTVHVELWAEGAGPLRKGRGKDDGKPAAATGNGR